MKQATFAQWFCLIVSGACLLLLGIIFFVVFAHPNVLDSSAVASFLTGISAGVLGALAACYRFITGSSADSQAKDVTIANSTPVVPEVK